MTTLPEYAPPTLIDRIRDGMRGEEAKDKLERAIARTAEYLDGLRRMLARIDHTDVEIDDAGNVDGLDGLLRWIDESQQPSPPDDDDDRPAIGKCWDRDDAVPSNDDAQIIEPGEKADLLDGDAHAAHAMTDGPFPVAILPCRKCGRPKPINCFCSTCNPSGFHPADSTRFLTKDEIDALRIDAEQFAMGPYDPLS